MSYNHAFDFAFEIGGSIEKDGSDVTPDQIRSAIFKRVNALSDVEILEATGLFDSYEEEERKVKRGFMTTIKIIIPEEQARNEGEACDWIHSFMDQSMALDWVYVVNPKSPLQSKKFEYFEYDNQYCKGDISDT